MLLIYINSNRTSQPFLSDLVLPTISKASASYEIVDLPFLTPVVKCMAYSFGHLARTCNTPVFYRLTVESILTGSQLLTGYKPSVDILITLPSEWQVGHCHSEVFSHPDGHCHSKAFCVPNEHCHSAVFSVLYSHCHSEVFSVLYGHCNLANYHSSAVVMNVSRLRTASRQNDAASSHSCHFNTVLYPRSIKECELPLNRSHRDIWCAASSVQNYPKYFTIHSSIFTGTSADLSMYIQCYIL